MLRLPSLSTFAATRPSASYSVRSCLPAGSVLLIWAIYSIASGLTDPFIDNGAHIGGALGGALIATRLHPVVLSPLPPERATIVRRWVGLVVVLLAYAIVGWVRR